MAGKRVKIGSLMALKDGLGNERLSIGLGNKSKDPKYNLTVEVTVRDNTGKVVARQTDGFINLEDPRTQHEELLKAGIISEEVAVQMKERASKIPDKVKRTLSLPRL